MDERETDSTVIIKIFRFSEPRVSFSRGGKKSRDTSKNPIEIPCIIFAGRAFELVRFTTQHEINQDQRHRSGNGVADSSLLPGHSLFQPFAFSPIAFYKVLFGGNCVTRWKLNAIAASILNARKTSSVKLYFRRTRYYKHCCFSDSLFCNKISITADYIRDIPYNSTEQSACKLKEYRSVRDSRVPMQQALARVNAQFPRCIRVTLLR